VPVDLERVAAARLWPFAGSGYRQLSPRYDPLSGEGARLNNGRLNHTMPLAGSANL
jgi:RES domain-containing protein